MFAVHDRVLCYPEDQHNESVAQGFLAELSRCFSTRLPIPLPTKAEAVATSAISGTTDPTFVRTAACDREFPAARIRTSEVEIFAVVPDLLQRTNGQINIFETSGIARRWARWMTESSRREANKPWSWPL
jgi:hypothetical protein